MVLASMADDYDAAAAKMDDSIAAAWAAVQSAEPERRAELRKRYRDLCNIRRELRQTANYLRNYWGVKFVVSKSWAWYTITDADRVASDGNRRQWQLGGCPIADRCAETAIECGD